VCLLSLIDVGSGFTATLFSFLFLFFSKSVYPASLDFEYKLGMQTLLPVIIHITVSPCYPYICLYPDASASLAAFMRGVITYAVPLLILRYQARWIPPEAAHTLPQQLFSLNCEHLSMLACARWNITRLSLITRSPPTSYPTIRLRLWAVLGIGLFIARESSPASKIFLHNVSYTKLFNFCKYRTVLYGHQKARQIQIWRKTMLAEYSHRAGIG